jgi:hypothetical protein
MATRTVGLETTRFKLLTIEAEDSQSRSDQSTLFDRQALQAAAGSTRERVQGVRGSSSSSRWWLLLVAAFATLLCLPFVRAVGISDEGLYLHGAERLLGGSKLYADFFEYLPPGGFLLTEAWFSITGISFGSARFLAILTIVGIACFTYLACRQASKNAPLSALLATAWVVTSQGIWTQVSHHWFTTLFSMVTAWAALASLEPPQRWLRWPLIAGTAAGMAAMVTPHRGALVMLAAMTAFLKLRRHWPELIVYILGCSLVPVGLLAYVVWHHALAAAFDDVIRFTANQYAPTQGVPFGFGSGNPFLKYLFFPLAGLLTFLVCTRDWRTCLRDRLLWTCVAFALAGFLGCFPRPDVAHISFAAPLACPLLAYCIIRLTQWWRPAWWRYRYLVVVIAGIVIGFGISTGLKFLQTSQEVMRMKIVPTPRGSVALFGAPGISELLARIAATPSEDSYFFYPSLSILSFLTAREQVSKYDLFIPGFTPPSQYQDACISVMQQAAWVIIDRHQTDPKALEQGYPAIQNTEPRETKHFEQALDGGFELVAQEGRFELRHRREHISDTLCSGIAE